MKLFVKITSNSNGLGAMESYVRLENKWDFLNDKMWENIKKCSANGQSFRIEMRSVSQIEHASIFKCKFHANIFVNNYNQVMIDRGFVAMIVEL